MRAISGIDKGQKVSTTTYTLVHAQDALVQTL